MRCDLTRRGVRRLARALDEGATRARAAAFSLPTDSQPGRRDAASAEASSLFDTAFGAREAMKRGLRWTGRVAERAATSRRWSVILWATGRGFGVHGSALSAAVANQEWAVARWLRRLRSRCDTDKLANSTHDCDRRRTNASFNCSEFKMAPHRNAIGEDELRRVVRAGCVDALQALVDSNHVRLFTLCGLAAEAGHTHILQWAWRRGFEPTAFACWAAAATGHLKTLRWLHGRGCEWDECACEAAACGGMLGDPPTVPVPRRLATLTYLRDHGAPWSATACLGAVNGGSADVLRWLVERGCPINDEVRDAAEAAGFADAMEGVAGW